jgi:hypothetical protein
MSTEQDRVRQLASRIAQRVARDEDGASEGGGAGGEDELASVRQSIAELKRKLETIEEHLSHDSNDAIAKSREAYPHDEEDAPQEKRASERKLAPTSARSPWLSGIYVPAAHPSQERFGIEEAAVSELVDFFEKEKVCELEPGGKPCTHCDMCSTRGF